MFGETRLAAFDAHLKAAGVPIDGLSQAADAPAGITIQFRPEATPEQIAWAENEKLTFDWRARRALSRNAIVAAIAALTAAQQNAILRHAVAYLLRQNAPEAANISAVLGTALAVDEVDPNE